MLKRNIAWLAPSSRSRAAFLYLASVLVMVSVDPQLAVPQDAPTAAKAPAANGPRSLGGAHCTPADGEYSPRKYDVIVVGAGLAGLSATKELKRLHRSVLVLEANDRIGGRGYAGKIGKDRVPVDYGGAWIHGVPTNPLTALVDSMGFTRERTQLNLPYFVNSEKASEEKKKVFDQAVEQYEDAVDLAAKSIQDQHALAEFACNEYKKHVSQKEICRDLERRIPFSRISLRGDLCRARVRSPEEFCAMADNDLRITSDVARDYVPQGQEFKEILPLLIANAGPLESAAEMNQTSAVEAVHFEAGDDDLIAQGMGTFVEKFGEGLPVCLKSPVAKVEYSKNGVAVTVGDGRVFEGSTALVTVSVGVLKAKKIAFEPELPKDKLNAIASLRMGNMQKVIVPLNKDIFPNERMNSWILYEGDLSPDELEFAKSQGLPLVDGNRVVMGFVIKPLNKNIAIGFFGGDWAKALEHRCSGTENGSGVSSNCDDISIKITKSALSRMSGEINIDQDIEGRIQLTRWSLDSTSFGAYSVAEPGNWYQREVLAEPVEDAQGKKRLFFAGEGTARAIYNGSFPGAYESGLKAARDINAAIPAAEAERTAGP